MLHRFLFGGGEGRVCGHGGADAFLGIRVGVEGDAGGFAVGIEVEGMVLSMIIMILIGKRNWVQMVLVSVLVPLLMWLVFYKVLTVNIPLGPLNFLRTLVDMI